MVYKQIGRCSKGCFIGHLNRDEIIKLLARRYKRELINRGIIQNPATRPPRYKFTWTYGNLGGAVYADHRSHARALIKYELGLKKKNTLPKNVEIVAEPNEQIIAEQH